MSSAKHKSESQIFLTAVCIGVSLGLAVTLGLILLMAALVTSGKLPESWMQGLVLLAITVGVLCGSLYAARAGKSRHLLAGILVGFVTFALLFTLAMIFSYPELGAVPACAMLTLGAGAAGAIPALSGRKSHKKKRNG